MPWGQRLGEMDAESLVACEGCGEASTPTLLDHRRFPLVGAVDHLPTGATEPRHPQAAAVDHEAKIPTGLHGPDFARRGHRVIALDFVMRHASGRRSGSALFQNSRFGTFDIRAGIVTPEAPGSGSSV